ncbi:MAG: HD domain-containing protein [Bacteroidales bacterium]|nr:HD domain-containing protein [Bacteroidales bacterium]
MAAAPFTEQDYNLINKEFESLMELAVKRCRNEQELSVVRKAFEFANIAHKDVRRRSGEPYIIHPISVAKIVVSDIGLGFKSITAALLHDVIDNSDYTLDDIRNLFADNIAALVEGLTKMKTVLDNEEKNHDPGAADNVRAENLKRILLTLNDDARVVLIKLADRLHNCRTIGYMPEPKRERILAETMYIFIPLAHRLGLYSIKSEMEDIWLKYKESEAYAELTGKIADSVDANKGAIEEFIAPIAGALKRDDFDFEIKERIKSPYSVWHKMKTKNVPFEQIFDLYAVRIIFNPSSQDPAVEKKEAYMIYADIMGLYKENPGRHRDWIDTPKSNGYEALHCTLMSQAGIWVEVQIRSRRMDDIAEKGIAAHWAYKRGGYASENESKMDKWLSQVKDILASKDIDAIEFLNIFHSDLIATDIVVFSPKGDQVSIPNGATAHDFAYYIHSDIGDRAVAAKINKKIAPLSQVLKTGDQIEIITSQTSHPYKEWLKYLKTRNARSKVVSYFRSARESFIGEGREIYNDTLRSLGISPSHDYLRTALESTQVRDSEEFFFRVGLGLIPGDSIRKALVCLDNGPQTAPTAVDASVSNGVPVHIRLRGLDRIGLLNDITGCLSLIKGVNITKLGMGSENGMVEGSFEMTVSDRDSLVHIINELKKINGIQDVARTDI